MRLTIVRRLVLTLAAAAAAGCTSNLGPADLSGTYVLRSIDGQALPALYSKLGYLDGPPSVFADTLRIGADGVGTRVRLKNDGFPSGTLVREAYDIRATAHGGAVELRIVCPTNATCFGIGPAHLTPGGLVIEASGEELGPQTYVRISRSSGA